MKISVCFRLAALTSCVLSLGTVLSINARAQNPPPGVDQQRFAQIEQGRYLADIGDCVSCHTAPEGKDFAGGLKMNTPFGVIVSPNITPDRQTGIGTWTDEDFIRAMREGKRPDGSHLYPAMPYPNYTKVSNSDLLAIRAYLSTLDPVLNDVKTDQLAFPFSIRSDVIVWNMLEFTSGAFKPDPNQSTEWNRGAYLVEGLGHCGVCHTPKTALFGDKNNVALQGATLDGWFAPNITNDSYRGIGKWELEDLTSYLKTGINRWTVSAAGMEEVITNSTSKMTDSDIRAIAVYLKSLPAQSNQIPQSLSDKDPRMVAGAAIYKDSCSACHSGDGMGAPGLFPRLAQSPLVQSVDSTTIIRTILTGDVGAATDAAPTGPQMPAYSWLLNDEQVASVATYIRNKWGNAAEVVTPREVAKIREIYSSK